MKSERKAYEQNRNKINKTVENLLDIHDVLCIPYINLLMLRDGCSYACFFVLCEAPNIPRFFIMYLCLSRFVSV